MAKEFSPSEVAARSGIAVSALHFYERKGLIRSHRTSGNQRRYERDVLRRLAVIRLAGELGIPLSAVADSLAKLPEGRTPSKDDWAAMSQSWKEDLDRRLTLITRLRDELQGCIGCGCLSMHNCPLINPGDHLSGKGTGAIQLYREGNASYDSSK